MSSQDQSSASSGHENRKLFHPLSTAAVITCLFSVHIQTFFLPSNVSGDIDVSLEHIVARGYLGSRALIQLSSRDLNLQLFHFSAQMSEINKEKITSGRYDF